MREIKFRMYSKKKKVMHYWDHIKQFQLAVLDDNNENEKYSSWMQYTGLKDANGREIYEGDILKRTVTVVMYGSGKPPEDIDEYMKVEYREDYAGFYIGERPLFAYVDNTRDVDTGCRCTKAEVIGNIYEDPQLLEAAE
ncbi:YopX family protein [Bacillus subtilis]|uniref:YopX family protein n=1 Tax=Bacillus subtilis TaxID=1423 RepID=UPI00030E3B72|nr:YopX family protein [Bacillus subtilis]MEC1057931.1 YopX family protein [Bacillus subtilis]